MKFKLTTKKAGIIILAIIIIPIVYNKISGTISGLIQKRAMMQPKEVVIDKPIKKEILISAESTGRVEAKYSVDVVARVSGFLINKYFKEGDWVKKGQTIFQIDPREFKLEVNNAQASVNQYSALLKNAQQELDRANALVKEDLISRSDVDSSLAARNQNQALMDAAKQKLELAKVNLSYTSIKSPIDGRIGKVQITEGNYVTAASGSLVNISSVDPVYVSFSLKSDDFIKLLKASDKYKDVDVKIQIDDHWYDKSGIVDFVDNQIDKDSGSIAMRATFDNKRGWLVPGDYVKVKLTATKAASFMTIPQSATKGDAMSGYYVWAVDKDNKAVRKDIKVSDVIDNNWVVDEGLNYNDTVVVVGIQNISFEGQKLKLIQKEEYDQTANAGN